MNNQTKSRIRKIGWLFFIIYIVGLAYCLFFSERYGRVPGEGYSYNLVLFKEINRFVKYRHLMTMESFLLNLFGNVIGFMPFGFFVPMLSRKKGFFSILCLAFLFSLTIETVQLVLKVGTFDVDDLFLNTLGGILGYICYAIFHGIYRIKYSINTKKENGKKSC